MKPGRVPALGGFQDPLEQSIIEGKRVSLRPHWKATHTGHSGIDGVAITLLNRAVVYGCSTNREQSRFIVFNSPKADCIAVPPHSKPCGGDITIPHWWNIEVEHQFSMHERSSQCSFGIFSPRRLIRYFWPASKMASRYIDMWPANGVLTKARLQCVCLN